MADVFRWRMHRRRRNAGGAGGGAAWMGALVVEYYGRLDSTISESECDRVSTARTQMQVDEKLVDLSPGTAGTVEIKTGTRHVIDFLLSPLAHSRQQALREP